MKNTINTKEIIFALSNILDMADSHLAMHQQRVAYIAWKIALEAKLDKSKLESLFVAALLHDIGALSLEEKVKITKGEESNTQRHTILGQKILAQIPWMQEASFYVKYHHKRWDSYQEPEKNSYCLPAQILYLADMVDRLIDKNKYILDQDDYLKTIIQNLSGEHFSPNVVQYFLSASKNESFWLDLLSVKLPDILKANSPYQGVNLTLKELLPVTECIRKIIDFKSPFTSTHSAGVAEAAVVLSDLLNHSDETAIAMRNAGNIHDIGKLVIPEHILEKEGRLSDQEYRLIKQHSYQTYMALYEVTGLGDIVEWASFHHERLNGSGYPFGLHADKLSEGARLMAVADIFTAIIEDRPYRQGMKKTQVIALLEKQSSEGLLDKNIVHTLIANYDHCSMRVKSKQKIASEHYKMNFETQ